jgi:cleavage stimulation factor subunit 3
MSETESTSVRFSALEPTNVSTDPLAIVQELQTLNDIEGDLIDTAQAVHNLPVGEEDAELMQSAEAVESVLEQSIPEAPATTLQIHEEETNEDPVSMPASEAVESSDMLPAISENPTESTSDDIIDIVQQAEGVVQSIVPIAFTDVAPPSDPKSNGVISGEGEASMESQATVTEAVLSGLPQHLVKDTDAINGTGSGSSTPLPLPPVTISSTLPPIPAKPSQAHAVTPSTQPDVALPQGLNGASPSVIANSELMRQWRSGTYTARLSKHSTDS